MCHKSARICVRVLGLLFFLGWGLVGGILLEVIWSFFVCSSYSLVAILLGIFSCRWLVRLADVWAGGSEPRSPSREHVNIYRAEMAGVAVKNTGQIVTSITVLYFHVFTHLVTI